MPRMPGATPEASNGKSTTVSSCKPTSISGHPLGSGSPPLIYTSAGSRANTSVVLLVSSSRSAPPPTHASHATISVVSVAALRRFRMTRVHRALWMTRSSLGQQVSKYSNGDNDVRIPSGQTGERHQTYIFMAEVSPSFAIAKPSYQSDLRASRAPSDLLTGPDSMTSRLAMVTPAYIFIH